MGSGVVWVASLFLLCAGGCESSDPYEAAAEKMVAKVKELTTIIMGVKTEADAEAAATKLDAIATEINGLTADLKKQPKMTEDQKKKVKKVFDDAKSEMEAMTSGDNRIEDLQAAVKLSPSLEKVGVALAGLESQLASQGMPAN